MPPSPMEVLWPALRRAWRRGGYEEFWFQFRPRGSQDVLADIEAAVTAANESVKKAGWGEDVFAEGASDPDAGPVALMSRAGPEPGVRFWFDEFARHLEGYGHHGKVTAAPRRSFRAGLTSLSDTS